MKSSKYFVFIILILFLFTTINSEASYIWKEKSKELWPNYSIFLNDRELRKDDTYQELRVFFKDCRSPIDFYNRIEKYVNESLDDNENDLSWLEFRLPLIVDSIKNGSNATLWCQHQTFLFMAGVKAIFSHYDENLNRYVTNKKCGEFKIEIWRAFDLTPPVLPFRTHLFLVVDVWNGSETFEINNKTVDKIKIDNWYEEFKEFNRMDDCLFYHIFRPKINSVLFTKEFFDIA